MCWSPLGGGWLTGIVRRGMIGPPAGSRIDLAQKGGWSESWTNYDTEHTWRVLDEFAEAVRECDRSPAQVALNWLARRPGVSSAIVGAETLD